MQKYQIVSLIFAKNYTKNMLEHWFRPFNKEKRNFKSHSFGNKLLFFDEASEEVSSKVAIVGIDAEEADTVRKYLYEYGNITPKDYVTDFGNIKKNSIDFLIAAIKEIMAANMIPVLIGAKEKDIIGQFGAYHDRTTLPVATIVDAQLRYGLEKGNYGYLNHILTKNNQYKGLLHLSALASQAHLIDSNVWNTLEFQDFDLVRLGKCRSNMEEVEPLIRESDGMSFHINAIREADAPGQENAIPSGLHIEEACQLARYAGMSDRLTSIGFFDYEKKYDIGDQTAKCVAQMVWYFIDGVVNRQQDYPVSVHNMTEYLVEIKDFKTPFTFWKSNKSNRWWIQIPQHLGEREQNRLFSCSYNDYQKAILGELPERLWNGFKRFG
jgi:formiminoglutamase